MLIFKVEQSNMKIYNTRTRMQISKFISGLKSLNFENTFNPYVDKCELYDTENAPELRTNILHQILKDAEEREVEALWLGRDLGYRGGRRTGLAFTDDFYLSYHIKRWKIIDNSMPRITKGEMFIERTAKTVWEILNQIYDSIFLWNVFPLHPHEPDNPFTNRSHNSKEQKAGEEILYELVTILQPSRIIAIGNDASRIANRVLNSKKTLQVRHPSYGGKAKFLSQMRELYSLQVPK